MYLKRLFPLLFKNNDHFECDVCQIAKHKRIPFPLRPYQPSQPFFLMHSDLWGPSRVTTHINKKWFITFTNDHSRVCWVYLLKEKTKIPQIFETFYSMIHNMIQRLKFFVLIMIRNTLIWF